ncbi:MAG: fibronectin type III domain-containing protein [Prevotella sp.]|nr:fibronectin type III domain-containing protein [Prevotella sp.]
MKKRLSFLAMAFFAVLSASAQMFAYKVETTTTAYEDITNGIVVDLGGNAGSELSGLMLDADGNANFNTAEDVKAFPIGFDLNYNSKTMKYFLIGTDGEILLSDVETVTTDLHKKATNMFTTSGCHDAFGLVTREGVYGLDDTEISYKNEGNAGNRVLIIQYKNLGLQSNSWKVDFCAKVQLQYRIYEATGNISIQVNGFMPTDETGNYHFMRIGLLGDSNDFVQVHAYDGSATGAKDTSISYNADNYPADGTTYTFVAPDECMTPGGTLQNLVLTSTTTQISGSFKPSDADHYLVLAGTAAPEGVKPVDKTKYAVGDELGNAKVIAVVAVVDEHFNYADSVSFSSPNNMEADTEYSLTIIPYNSLGMGGPLYGEATTATIKTKPAAPESITTSDVDKTTMSVSVKAAGQVLVAMTTEEFVNHANQYLYYGVFGEPKGTYNVGDEIEGGGKVIFVGTPAEAIALTGLEVGKPYFFRAWSISDAGEYSSLYVDTNDVTASELPWELTIDETLVTEEPYLGWTRDDDENGIWNDNSSNGYIYSQINAVDETEGTVAWYESPYIYLGEGSNRIKVGVAGTQRSGWMQSGWTLGDNEKIVFQVTKDGVDYKDILTIDKNNCESLSNASFVPFEATFDELAGEKVRLRIYIHRFVAGQTQFNRIYIEQKPEVDYPSDIHVAAVDGGNVTLEWTAEEKATSYEVSYKKASDEEWGEAVATDVTSITLEGLDGLTGYEARVRSLTATAQSGWSDAVSFTTGASVPFEFVVNDAEDLSIWTAYEGELTENTELSEGGDILVTQRSGFGGMMIKNITFSPYGSSTNSWLVSPSISLGDNAAAKYQATLTLTSIYLGDEVTLKVVVAKDGENFSSANVIGTIAQSELPSADEEDASEEDASKDFTFDFTGFSGSIRLGYYIEGTGSDLTSLQFDKMGLKLGEQEATEATVTYAIQVGQSFTSGQTVEVKDGDDVVATITYGEAGTQVEGSNAYADFKAGKADSQVEGFVAFTEGNGENGNKDGGTFYTIKPKYDGEITIGVVLNNGKKFYVEEDGTALDAYNAITVSEKYYGTFKFDVKAGRSYKFYCAGSKLGFYGFNYTYDLTATGIESAPVVTVKSDAVYNLQGQRMTTLVPGKLYINNGRKFIAR